MLVNANSNISVFFILLSSLLSKDYKEEEKISIFFISIYKKDFPNYSLNLLEQN